MQKREPRGKESMQRDTLSNRALFFLTYHWNYFPTLPITTRNNLPHKIYYENVVNIAFLKRKLELEGINLLPSSNK